MCDATMYGQPLEAGLVELDDDPPPPMIDSATGMWQKQRHEAKRLRKIQAASERNPCNDRCCSSVGKQVSEWEARIIRSLEKENKTINTHRQVGSVEVMNDNKEVNAVPNVSEDIEVITVTVDSGAYNTVGPPTTGTHFPLN